MLAMDGALPLRAIERVRLRQPAGRQRAEGVKARALPKSDECWRLYSALAERSPSAARTPALRLAIGTSMPAVRLAELSEDSLRSVTFWKLRSPWIQSRATPALRLRMSDPAGSFT